MAKVDLLMATYNGELFIKAQIYSLLAQSFMDWQLIVHDDGSTDDTLKIIKEFASKDSRILVIEDEIKCGGAAENFMYMLKFSKANYIMFCDQDDIWFDNKIANQLVAIERRNNQIPQVVYSNSYVWKPNEGIKGLATLTFPRSINQFLFLNSGMQGCVAIFNRSLCNILISFKGKIAMHDHILHLTALLLGEVEYLSICLMLYRNHDNNVTGDTATSSITVKQIVTNRTLPVVDRKHYEAVLAFFEVFNSKIKIGDKNKIEVYLKMPRLNFVKKIICVLNEDFQLFNSRIRIITKILLRPYTN